MDKAKVPFVKNKNKSAGARRAGSGHQKAGANSCARTKANRARVKRQQPPPPKAPVEGAKVSQQLPVGMIRGKSSSRLRVLLNKNQLFMLTIHLNYKSVHRRERAESLWNSPTQKVDSLRQQQVGGGEVTAFQGRRGKTTRARPQIKTTGQSPRLADGRTRRGAIGGRLT